MSSAVAVLKPARRKYPRNPLRCIVARRFYFYRFDWQPHSMILHERLECGHPQTCIVLCAADVTAIRRRCAACAAIQDRRAQSKKRSDTALFASGVVSKRAPIPITAARGRK